MCKKPLSNKLIISSMMRSGSTLLQRALNAHKEICIKYQTNTKKFIDIKKEYLRTIGSNEYHVLSHYNPSSNYQFSDFDSWLSQKEELNQILNIDRGDKEFATISGVKEVLVEEFYSALLSRGAFCLNIIRDPRDVISSMSFGKGHEHTGNRRPVLFDLRNWRKSVHFAQALKENNNFKNILFEDLILNPDSVLKEIFNWLNVTPASSQIIIQELRKEDWQGNSSFGSKEPFDESALGKSKAVLPDVVSKYIEAICYKEMESLGYKINIKENDREEIISNYKDPFIINRLEFPENYSSSRKNVSYELKRV